MIFYTVYIITATVLVLHYTKFLEQYNMDWMLYVAVVGIFTVNILDYTMII